MAGWTLFGSRSYLAYHSSVVRWNPVKYRTLLFVALAGILVSLAQCTVNPAPTSPLEQLTLTPKAVDDFECWTAPQQLAPSQGGQRTGQLIVGYGVNSDLYRRDVSTTNYSLIDSDIGVLPSVSPDGHRLWYAVSQGGADNAVFIYDLLNGSKLQAPIGNGAWNWSADSQCLIGWHLETATAYRLSDGATQQKVFLDVPSIYEGTQAVSPSPDGHWWAWPCPGKGGVCVSGLNGQRVYDQALNLPRDLDEDSQMPYNRKLLRWSPKSDTLAFIYANRYYVADIHLRLVHFKENGGISYEDFKQHVEDLRWSPDDSRLLIFDSYGNPRLKLYDMENRTIVDLPNAHGYSERTTPAWSPNGEQIAFVGKDEESLYIMNIDGTDIYEVSPLPAGITKNRTIQYIFWTP